MSAKNRVRGVVYSTEHGRMCPACGNPASRCTCRREGAVPPGDGIVRIERSTKGRKGKGVTVITGIAMDPEGLRKLAKLLKKKCGSGGTVKDGTIEIQGDHRDLLVEELEKRGHKVKLSGG